MTTSVPTVADAPPPSYLYDPGPSASDHLRRFLAAFAPHFTDSSRGGNASLDVESFAAAELIRAHGPEEGGRLARAYRPAIERTEAKIAEQRVGENDDGSALLSTKIVSAKLCAYAGMYDFFCKFDGGISDTFGMEGDDNDGGDDGAIQLSEWIYGYRIVLRGAFFRGLKIRTEKQARRVFAEICSQDREEGEKDATEIDYGMWCDYLENQEMGEETGLGTLFDGRAEEEEREAAAASVAAAGDAARADAEERKQKEEEAARLEAEQRAEREKKALAAAEAADSAEEAARKETEERERQEKLEAEQRAAQEEKAKAKARLAKEQARIAEEKRLAEGAKLAEMARIAEQKRVAQEEAKLAEMARIAEERRVAQEEEARLAEEKRLVEEARLSEEARIAKESRHAEDAKVAEEARREEEAKVAEQARKANEVGLAVDARVADEAHKSEDFRLAEAVRQAGMANLAEAARPIEEEECKAEEARLAEKEMFVKKEAKPAEETHLAQEATPAEGQGGAKSRGLFLGPNEVGAEGETAASEEESRTGFEAEEEARLVADEEIWRESKLSLAAISLSLGILVALSFGFQRGHWVMGAGRGRCWLGVSIG